MAPAESPAEEALGPLLAALTEEAHREAAAVRTEIMREFAAGALHARRYASRHERAGILRALKDRRKAALAMAKRNAALELLARQRAALRMRRGPPRTGKTYLRDHRAHGEREPP